MTPDCDLANRISTTPGPWTVEGSYVLDRTRKVVAIINHASENEDVGHLIGAAPDLLSALRSLVDYCQFHEWWQNNHPEIPEAARAAIAKAMGAPHEAR